MEDVASRIEDVVVYAGAARVRRLARVSCGAEPTRIRIGGLPLALRDGSVRLAADGPLIAADARVVVDVPGVDVALPPADPEALDAARAAVAVAAAEVARLRRALAQLAALTPGERDGRPEDPVPAWGAAVDARLGLLALRGDRERALRVALGEAERAAEDARRDAARAEDAYRRATSARAARPHELRKAVIVTLRPSPGSAGGAGDVILDYVVPGARWAPTYVARLDPAGGPAVLELRAVIAQATGEDWRDVRLSLSTAAATSWTELPELPSLRLGRRQPPPPRAGWRPPPTGVDALYADWDRAFGGQRDRLAAARAAALGVPAAGPEEPTESFPLDEFTSEEGEEITDLRAPPMPPTSAPPMAPPMMPPPGGVPMSMPTFAAPPMQAMTAPKRGNSLAGALGGLVAAPAALVAAGAGAVAKSISREQSRGRRIEDRLQRKSLRNEAFADGGPEPEPTELVAPADLLAYGDLRMPAAPSTLRGALAPADRRELYLSVLVTQQVALTFDVITCVADAERAAERAATVAPPPGCRAEWSDAYDYAFDADARLEVPSDGAWHGVALGRRDAPVAIRHVAVPREVSDVFRMARLDNPHDAPLLPGPLDVYDGRDFLLTTAIDFTPPGGHVEVGLGVDQRVKIARNSRYREETTGMLRGSLRLEHEVEIEVENLHARPIDLEVRERLPVPGGDDDDTEIEVDRVEPAWQAWTPEPAHPGEPRLRGGHRWRLEVAAGGKRTLALGYHIKIAGKHELVGGNRREQ